MQLARKTAFTGLAILASTVVAVVAMLTFLH